MTIGAFVGGKIMNKIGRKNTILVCVVIGIVGLGITMIFNFYTLTIGRFIFGLSCGIISITIPRFMEETIPRHLFDILAPTFNIFTTSG